MRTGRSTLSTIALLSWLLGAGVVPPAAAASIPSSALPPTPTESVTGPADCVIPGLDDHCEAWTATYDGPSGGEDTAGDGGLSARRTIVTSLDDSTVYVAGTAGATGTDFKVVTIAYDTASGARRWVAVYDGPDQSPRAQATSLAPDGHTLYVLVSDGCGGGPARLVAYDALSGQEQWETSYAGGDDPCVVPTNVVSVRAPSGGSRVYVSGFQSNRHLATAAWLVAFDVDGDGSLVGTAWQTRTAGPEEQGGLALGLAASPDGETVYLAGGLNRPGTSAIGDFAILAYRAADGSELWHEYRSAPGTDGGNGLTEVAVVGDRVFASGLKFIDAGSAAIDTFAFDGRTGDLLWSQSRTGNNSWASGEGMLAVAGGRLFVTASLTGDATTDNGYGWMAAAYDQATGAQLWAVDSVDPIKRMVAAYSGFNPAIAASPSGDRVYVTGYRGQHYKAAATTIAYDGAAGSQLWSARWLDGSSHPTTLVASRDGRRVFVTGTTTAVETYPARSLVSSGDIMTIAYDA